MKRLFSPRVLVAALALSLGLGAAAIADPSDLQGLAGCTIEMRVQRGLKELARLHADLNLDSRQEILWQQAERGLRDSLDSMRGRLRQQHQQTLAQLSQPGADLRALAGQADRLRAEASRLREANREQWLAVYDNLSPEQKERVRIFLKDKLERFGLLHLGGGR